MQLPGHQRSSALRSQREQLRSELQCERALCLLGLRTPRGTQESRECHLAVTCCAHSRIVEVDRRTAHNIEFAGRAATHALRADSDGDSVIGTSLEQRVTTVHQDESLRSLLASVPAGGGPAVKFNAELRGISFKLQVSCVSMVQKRVIAV